MNKKLSLIVSIGLVLIGSYFIVKIDNGSNLHAASRPPQQQPAYVPTSTPSPCPTGEIAYQSILSDIFTIAKSSGISECSKNKVINLLLETTIDPYMVYPKGVKRSTIPFDSNTLWEMCEEGQDLKYKTRFFLQAEHAKLVAPMISTYGYVYSAYSDSGTATFNIEISTPSKYILLASAFTPSFKQDSFYVSLDDKNEEAYNVSMESYSASWKWAPLTPITSTEIPKLFDLTIGTHTIVFRAREPFTYLDKIFLSKDISLRK